MNNNYICRQALMYLSNRYVMIFCTVVCELWLNQLIVVQLFFRKKIVLLAKQAQTDETEYTEYTENGNMYEP